MKKVWQPMALSVVVLLLASGALWARHNNHDGFGLVRFLNTLEWAWYDFKFRARPAQLSSGVMVARIDDTALNRYGRWPWTRVVYKEIIDKLYGLGAEVVAFDAVFSEPEYKKEYVLQYLQSPAPGKSGSLKDLVPLNSKQLELISDVFPAIGDTIFKNSVLNNPKTVLGYIWENEEACGADTYGVDLPNLESQAIFVDGAPAVSKKTAGDWHASFYQCPISNRSILAGTAKHQGFFNAFPELDGIFRKIRLVVGFNPDDINEENKDWMRPEFFQKPSFFPSLVLASLASLWDASVQLESTRDKKGKWAISAVTLNRKALGPLRIPTLPDGSLTLNYYGTQQRRLPPIPEFSLGAMESHLSDPEFQDRYGLNHSRPLTGQIVLIGPTALGVYDLRPTPVQANGVGVFIHATAVGRILEYAKDAKSHFTVHFASFETSLSILLILGFILAVLITSLRAFWGATATVAGIVLFLSVDFILFSKFDIALDAMTVMNTLSGVFIAVFAYKYFTEEKDRAFVKAAFEKYVSPDLVGAILKDPKKLNLGGQKKSLTVMFSDIRGFTTISEKLGAAELAKFLNDYLSPMTDIVIGNKGTIDKYMGDAIMAIFGAPVEYSEHAQCAADAALGMITKLNELRSHWAAVGLPMIDIGIGLNTGDMSVGNMGSTRIFSYTVMGDAVNLGSRIEGLNKDYGTQIIISEYTREALGSEYRCRELDRVKVKGKQQAVQIFELRGKGPNPEDLKFIENFEAALALYYKAKFLEAKVLFMGLEKIDPSSEIYARRCESWIQEPPPADWDGSWTMTHK